MKKQVPPGQAFPFLIKKVTLNENINKIKNLDESKATPSNVISIKVVKENYDIFATFITENFNNMIAKSVFPDSLKWGDIKPVYEKNPEMKRKITGL